MRHGGAEAKSNILSILSTINCRILYIVREMLQKLKLFIICFIFMLHEVLFSLHISHLCYMFYYLFIKCLYVLHMFFMFVIYFYFKLIDLKFM